MRKQRRTISKDMRHQIGRSIADTAGVLATHRARATILETVKKAEAKADDETKSITAPALEGGGKLNPAHFPNSGIAELTEGDQPTPPTAPPKKTQKNDPEANDTDVSVYAPVMKINEEKRTVMGVVLQPEVVDAQGDIISEAVIEKAAENFLAKFNKATKLGYMHKNFSKKFELLQSFVAPSDIVIGNKIIKKGAWVMKVRVIDNAVWKLVKDGKIKGFSIGGKAKVQKLAAA